MNTTNPGSSNQAIRLREVQDSDLASFFAMEQDPEANRMAAFTGEDPSDRAAFESHWAKIRAMDTVVIRTILTEDRIAGHVASFLRDDDREITYWIDAELWGKGIVTRALAMFLEEVTDRPIHARAAADNLASLRVLEKCGFKVHAHERGYANARHEEIDEVVLVLHESATGRTRP